MAGVERSGPSGRPPAGHLQLGVAARGHCAALTAATEWRACPTTASPNTDPRQSRFTLLNVNESQLSPFALHHGVSFIGVHYAYFGRVAAKDRPSDHKSLPMRKISWTSSIAPMGISLPSHVRHRPLVSVSSPNVDDILHSTSLLLSAPKSSVSETSGAASTVFAAVTLTTSLLETL